MQQKSIAAQIVEAIKNEDCQAIISLFIENPEQAKAFTPFGGQTWLAGC